MKDKIYTMKQLCKELDQPRQKLRRRLIKLDIKAVNEEERTYQNEPLEYDYQAFSKLAEEFDVKISEKDCTVSVQHRTTDRSINEQQHTAEKKDKDKLIEVLEEQLKETNKSKANLEKMLDQQQQLNLISNQKVKELEVKVEKSSKKSNEVSKKGFFQRLKFLFTGNI